LALVISGIAFTSAGHYLTPPEFLLWHGIFQHLYYLPVVYAGVAFGWVGGLIAGTVSALLYLPHIVMAWSGVHHYAVEQYVEIIIFVAVGLVTGVLSDRERKRRLELQVTAAKLHRANLELQSSFEQVKRADRLSAVGQLAAGLVHEIRNPIASIDGAAEVMEATDEPHVLRTETMAIIRKECSRLNRLLSSLLDFARPRNPEWGSVDVSELLRSVTELMRHSAPKDVGIGVRERGPLPEIDGDTEQLAQVLLNLTINAVQAMPQGGEVELVAFERSSGVTIQVSDNGVGVSEENLEKIFDPFFTTKDSGTGLGLSVAHQIVRQHGGSITVGRNAGQGMTFSVWLPRSARREG
jgi:signal transduction histidine kinase